MEEKDSIRNSVVSCWVVEPRLVQPIGWFLLADMKKLNTCGVILFLPVYFCPWPVIQGVPRERVHLVT